MKILLSICIIISCYVCLAVGDSSSSLLNKNAKVGRKAPYVFLGARAKDILKAPKKHKDLGDHGESSNIRYQLKRVHSKARPIFKAAKKAHETIEDTKLLLKHTEQEIVQLDSQEVSKLNSRHLRNERNVTKRNITKHNIKKEFNVKRQNKKYKIGNLTAEQKNHTKKLPPLVEKTNKLANQVKDVKGQLKEVEKESLKAIEEKEKKKKAKLLEQKKKQDQMKEEKFKYYERKRKENDLKLKNSMSKEDWNRLVQKRKNIKDTFWHTERDKKHEQVLGWETRNKNDKFVENVNATDDEMGKIENEIGIMDQEDKERKDNDTSLYNALDGYFPIIKEEPKDMNDTDILTDCIEEVNCTNTLANLRMCMKRVTDAGETASIDEAQQQFSACARQRAMEEAAESDQDNAPDLTPNRNFEKVNTVLEENFEKGTLRGSFSTLIGVQKNSTLGAKSGRDALVFNFNREGVSLDSEYHRSAILKPFDLTAGGVISFQIKDGPDDGGKVCKWQYEELKRLEAEKIARKQAEFARRDRCRSYGPEKGGGCNGHGRGSYTSSCNDEWYCDTNHENVKFNATCVCHCDEGYVGKHCEIRFTWGHCRSVGDPHPNTADGVYYNIYDAGEFIYYSHPESRSEVHALLRMAHPSISATSAVAVRVCEKEVKYGKGKRGKCDTISFEAPNCKYSNYKVSVEEDGKCKGVNLYTRYRDYYTKNVNLRYNYPWNIYGPNVRMYTPGWWQYGWYHHQKGAGGCDRGGGCRSWYGCGNWGGYLNAYLSFKGPRDGKSIGMCGDFSGSSGRDYHEVIRKGHRSSQWGRDYRDKVTVKAEDSFFKCGNVYDYTYTYSPYRFKSTKTGAKMTAMQRIQMATEQLAQEFATDKIMNKKAGQVKAKLTKAQAIAKCKAKKPAPTTEEALNNCVEDMTMVDDDKVQKNAVSEANEEIEEAYHEAKADEADEKLELVAEAALKRPQPLDPILQYCVDPEARENVTIDAGMLCLDNNTKAWKQLKAYPANVYSGFLNRWRYMTARIPQQAMNASVHLRFYQKRHTCYCCDQFAIDDIKVVTGGWPVRLVGDKGVTLYADGKQVGDRVDWWGPAKDTYRYRVDANTEIFGLKIESAAGAKMGVIGSFGDSLVTSSTWKCKSFLTDEEQKIFANKDFDDSNWPTAVELGQNGILPWGARPGIAKKAFWINTQESENERETVWCRVNSSDAWHSYSKDHLAASRWSCKSWHERQSPFRLQMDKHFMSQVFVRSGGDKYTHYSSKPIANVRDGQSSDFKEYKDRICKRRRTRHHRWHHGYYWQNYNRPNLCKTEVPHKMCKEICLHDPNCEAYEVNQIYSGKNYEECTITGRNINSCPNGADLCKDYDDVWTCPKDVKYVKFNSLDRQGGSLHTDFKHVKGTNCNVKFSIGSEEVIMRIRTSKIIEKTEEGAMFKRVMLRLFVKDATKDPVKVCKNVQKYDKGTVTWQSKPTVGKNPMDCVTFKPSKRFTWVSIDITDWVREWASNPKSNLGMTFIASSDDTFSFSTGLYPDPRERPILSLSCHGDRDDIGEQPEMKRNYVREMNRIANDMKKKHKKNPYGSKRKGGNETVVEKQEDALDDINDNIENDQTVLQLGNYSMSASNVQLDKKSGWSSQGYEEEKAKKNSSRRKSKKNSRRA